MKCNSCGTDIAPNMVKCPICGVAISNTSVLPTTPTTPALPSDQNVDNVITTQIPIVVPNEVDEKVQMGNVELSTTPTPSTPAQVINDVQQADTITVQSGEKENINKLVVEPVKKEEVAKKKVSVKSVKKLVFVLLLLLILGGVGYYFYSNIFKTSKDRINESFNQLTSYLVTLGKSDNTYRTGNVSLDVSIESKDLKFSSKGNAKYGLDLKNSKLYGTFNLDELKVNDKSYDNITSIKDNTIYLYDNNVYLNIPDIYDKYVNVYKAEGVSTTVAAVDYNTFLPYTKSYITAAVRQMPSTQKIKKISINGKDKLVNLTTISINPTSMKAFNNAFSTFALKNEKYVAEYAKFKNITEKAATKELEELPNQDVSDASGTIEVYTSILGGGPFKTTVYGFKVTTKSNGKVYVFKYTLDNSKKVELLVDNKKVLDLKYSRSVKGSNGNKVITYNVDGKLTVNDEDIKFTVKYVDTQDKTADMQKISIKDAVDVNHIPNDDKPGVLEKIQNANILDENTLLEVSKYLQYEENQELSSNDVENTGEQNQGEQSQEVE